MREILVSRFETFTDDFHFDDNKSICNIAVNTKEQTISFTVESGDLPKIYVILMIMSVNKTWLQIVDIFEVPADMSRYFLLTRWLSFDASDYYLCHEGDNGVPVIDRCLFKCGDDRGISLCILSPLDYLMLVEYDSRFGFSTPKSRLKELREDYGFRYIK
ncbi:hypothetical protein [Ruminococcus flavefaciens]|uniref:Uncharacterized protein n=1 Tax=Ruminococcus flavefaciens TaxID=1265 RepID=A0A315XXP9_RUMFL|nr:hypothetical protein [Ruminococcus flavefaciens]PWJ12247.1 hypothetical protein IE37_01937 [Ruminococcus flavefaciens]SSA49737.1 hypothetical protein SAMN02910325_01937 [Ruminococcus flavefaciens]